MPRFDEFITRQGITIKLEETCPADIEAMARRDAEAARWEE